MEQIRMHTMQERTCRRYNQPFTVIYWIDAQNQNQETFYDKMSNEISNELLGATLQSGEQIIDLLIQNGANVNVQIFISTLEKSTIRV